jgi:hypothetical protein
MPIKKFRTFEDASRDLIRRGDSDVELAARVAALWAFSAHLAPSLGFRGVRKYATLEEADADRQRMIMARQR